MNLKSLVLAIVAPLPAKDDMRLLRISTLVFGLALYGFGYSLIVLARLGLDPWNVLQVGIAKQVRIPLGLSVVLVGFVVLLLWIPFRQRIGIGTLLNVVIIGSVLQISLGVVPKPGALLYQACYLISGVVVVAVATSLYISTNLGPGPRDGLMTAIAARGHSIRVVRSVIELTVLVLGWILGGSVGVGTLIFALSIGPLIHLFLPLSRSLLYKEPKHS